MTILQVASLAFGYGADQLFEGVTFSLAMGERVALVAPNGAGKSTLLRLIAGELSPDAGQITPVKGLSVGYYRQSHELPDAGDVMGAFLSGFREVLDLRRKLNEAHERAASGAQADLDRLATLMDAYQQSHGDELVRVGAAGAARHVHGAIGLARVAAQAGGVAHALLVQTATCCWRKLSVDL